MTFEVTLEHGRPRDKGDIESMFNRGGGRLGYAPFGQKENAWNSSSATRDSKVDSSWKKGTNKGGISSGKDPVDVNGGGSFTGNVNSGYINNASGQEVSGVAGTVKKTWDGASAQAFKLAQQVGQSRGPAVK